jgi:ubiquinone/menaquinone biosynthesis C-methylase UbiE
MTEPQADIKKAVRRQFTSVAANYSTSAVHAAGADLSAMLDCATVPENGSLLDAGCGAGHTALAFAPHVRRVVACDLAPDMLAQTRRLAIERGVENILLQQGDVEQLPFASASFDMIVSRYSAHHWPHPGVALLEFARLLEPGGQFILSDIVGQADFAQDTFLQTFELLRDTSHVRDYSVGQWLGMMTEAGFAAEVCLHFDLPLNFGEWVTRMRTPDQNSAMIKTLFAGASQDIRTAFQLPDQMDSDDFEFVIHGAVFRAVKGNG